MQVRDTELDRMLAECLEDEVHVAPSQPVEAAIAHARGQPRGRDPLAWLRRDVMTTRTGSSGIRPAVIVAALVGVLVVAFGGYALASRPSGAATASVTPQAEATATPYVAPGANFRHPILQGDPIPAALVGAWKAESGYPDLVFYAAGSEACTEEFHTDQECVSLTEEGRPGIWHGGGIVVMRAGKLVYDETLASPVGMAPANAPCLNKGLIEELAIELDGDRLYLEPSGVCWPKQNMGWWNRD